MVTKYEQELVSDIAVASLDEIPDAGMIQVTIENKPILLCRFEGQVFAVSALCPHRGAQLARGCLNGALLRCPWHGIKFDVRTGGRANAPECRDLKVYPVVVKDEQVFVSFPTRKEE